MWPVNQNVSPRMDHGFSFSNTALTQNACGRPPLHTGSIPHCMDAADPHYQTHDLGLIVLYNIPEGVSLRIQIYLPAVSNDGPRLKLSPRIVASHSTHFSSCLLVNH